MPLWLALIISILIFGSYISFLNILASRSQDKITDQLPFILDTMSGALQSGYSLRQAFVFTTQETERPIQFLFEEGVRELNYNIPLEDVFESMQEKTTK